MKKYILKTQGCKSNQLESVIIKEKLDDAGYEQGKDIDDADIFILNSCSVTQNADIEALRFLRNAKNKNPSIITVITGCSAQLHNRELQNLDYIDFILGNDDKFRIVELLNSGKSSVSDIFEVNNFNNQFIKFYNNTRGYLKIQDGCNNYCSYCTIPLARGRSRSNSIKNIVEQIKIFTDILINLLEALENTDILRYRLGSLNTLEINDEMLDFLSQSEKFCPHFHLSLQSLTDKTLKAMNRHYTAQSCIELIDKINTIFKLPFIGSDIIAGFPGETDEDFDITLQNAENSGLSNIHVFPYSIRANTKAAQMDMQISEPVKHKRAEALKKVAENKFKTFEEKNINTIAQVLIEKRPDKKSGLLKGVTKNYLNVYIDSKDKTLHNTVQNVKILNRKDEKLFCTIIKE